jgi:glutathione peroxidase
MSKLLTVLAFSGILLAASSLHAEDKKVPDALNYTMKSLDGKDVDLSQYLGKVVLIVNTASQCGLTPQYEGLEKLHEDYAKDGLAVLGFPCNQFGKQEPGTAKEISTFCTDNYGVKFDMFAKVDVNGEDAAPLFKYLTSEKTNGKFAGPVKWNFNKFLINRQGQVVARFEPRTAPESEEVQKAIAAELQAK